MKKRYTTRQIAIMGIFVSVGIMLQYVENRILITPVPGGKLGLSNIVSIINIFVFGGRNAMIVSLIRAFLGTILTSGASALPYSFAGAFFSTLAMCLIKRFSYPKVSMVGMSVAGAAFHNLAQICVAAFMLSSAYIFSYLPILLIVSVVSGFVTGYGAQVFGNRVLKKGEKV